MKAYNTLGIILIIVIFQTSLIHSQDLSNLTLIAHYPLSSTANDTTGNYGSMDLTNTPFQDGGIYCNGIYAGGDPDACDARTPDITALNFESFAVSAMFKMDDPTDQRRPVFVCGRNYKWCCTFVDPDSTAGLGYSGTYYAAQSSGVKFTLGAWHEITFTHDSTEGIGKLYLDNILADSIAFQNAFKGFLKDLKIYSKSLSGLEQDSLALVALYNSTDGANWTDNTNWLTGPLSSWFGVTVSSGRVTKIDLQNNNLEGTLPVEIGALTKLTDLRLKNNQLSGSIPSSIGNLTLLRYLYLNENQFEGNIPPEIGSLTYMVYLYLSDNQLEGQIPSEIGNCINLSKCMLKNNQLSGPIPESIGNCSKISQISIHTNQLEGPIPQEFWNLTKMSSLSLDYNQFSGAIPAEILNMENLIYFYIADNQFTDLPDLSALPKLITLYIQNNHFTFEDIEPNISISNVHYSPQENIGIEQDTTIAAGEILTLRVDVGGTANQYQWYKDTYAINGADSSAYVIETIAQSDSGSYICEITNTIATDLTLYSRPIDVHISTSVGVLDWDQKNPTKFSLLQNYPNPFNPTTHISFSVPKPSKIKISVYDTNGRLIVIIYNNDVQTGDHTITWDASHLSSGLYFIKLFTDDFQQIRKCLLLK